MTTTNSNGRTLTEKLDSIHEVLDELRERLNRTAGHRQRKSLDEHSREFMDAILRTVVAAEELSMTREKNLASAMARSLLAVEKGARFEPCIMQAIRDCRTAYENVRRYRDAELPEPFKADVLARFRQQLFGERQRLEILGVSAFEPKEGDAVDPTRHRVAKSRKCEAAELSEKVAAVQLPGFEWIDDQGNVRVQAAEVIAFESFVPPAPLEPVVEGKHERKESNESFPRRPMYDSPRDRKSPGPKRFRNQ